MNPTAFAPELVNACLDMAAWLYDVAGGDAVLEDQAACVQRSYVRALGPAADEGARTANWRRFIGALDAYLAHCRTASPAAVTLRRIVLENADLLEREISLSA